MFSEQQQCSPCDLTILVLASSKRFSNKRTIGNLYSQYVYYDSASEDASVLCSTRARGGGGYHRTSPRPLTLVALPYARR